MPARTRAYVHPIRWDLVEESLEEGEFLWRRWQRAMAAADHDLAEVSRFVEERLLGCIDGLRVGADAAVERVLVPALDMDPPRRSVAALALAGGGEAARGRVATAFVNAPADVLPALARGIELVETGEIVDELERAGLASPGMEPHVQAAFLEICAFRRRAPGALLACFTSANDVAVQRSALVAARFAPRPIAEHLIESGLGAEPPAAAAAVESGLVLGLPGAATACADVLRPLAPSAAPLLLAYALGVAADRERRKLVDALGVESLASGAIWALGFAGTRAAVDACADLIRQGQHAALAFEAFCAITGASMTALRGDEADEAKEREDASAKLPPLEEDDLGADLTNRPEVLLPKPDAAAVARWWTANRPRFAPETRYLAGRPSGPAALRLALRAAPMRRRPALALDLAMQTRGAEQISALALCREQRRQIAASFGAPAGPQGPPQRK